MTEPGMYFQAEFMEAAASFPKEERDKIVAALVAYHFFGEIPEDTSGPVYALFIAYRDRIDMAKNRCKNGSKGGKASKAKAEAGDGQDASKPASKPASKTEAVLLKTKTKTKTKDSTYNHTATAPLSEPMGGEERGGDEEQGWIQLMGYAVRAYNERFGTDFPRFTIRAREGIKQAYADGRREEHVDKALRVAATWEERYRTPDAVFGDKFEQWLARPEPEEEKPPDVISGGIWGEVA